MGRPNAITLVDQVDDLFLGRYEVFLQALNLDLLVLVLEDLEWFVVVQQVINLAAIDFIHGHSDCEVPLLVLPVVYASLKKV